MSAKQANHIKTSFIVKQFLEFPIIGRHFANLIIVLLSIIIYILFTFFDHLYCILAVY